MKKGNIIYSYTIESHPDKQKVFEWIRNNWHDLGQHVLEEYVDSLKAACEALGVTFDYSISQVPDRGEFIKIGEYSAEAAAALPRDCSLTGVCYDDTVIEALASGDIESILTAIHAECEYLYSDEALEEMCEANEYEFKENGKIF